MFRKPALLLLVAASLAVTACATVPDAPMGPPNYAAIPQRPDPRARLYADCLGDAVAHGEYGHASDDSTDLILFTCTGPVAKAFYDGLAVRSAAVGSEFVHDGRTYRSTNPVVRDLFGVDYCSTDGTADHTCVVTLNAGEFLRDE